MNLFLTLAFLFFIGSVFGWVLELFFRKFFSGSNPEHKWINPGFCTGPYLPIYGFGLCALYLLARVGNATGLDNSLHGKAVLFVGMAVSMTLIEYTGADLPAVFHLLGASRRRILFPCASAYSLRTLLAFGESGIFFCDWLVLRRIPC